MLSWMHIGDISSLGMTNSFFRDLTQVYTLSKVYKLISSFGLSPEGILELLKDNRSIISGSAALQLMFTGSNVKPFEPKDIDFYVPYYRRNAVIKYFLKHTGFKFIASYRKLPGVPYASQYMHEVIIMESETAIINIIVSSTIDPLAPLFAFHFTAVMNAITAYGIWSAYPSLTLNFQSLINPMRSGDNSALSRARMMICQEKYTKRGFSISVGLHAWKEHVVHECSSYVNCPHTKRHASDEGTLFFPFRSLDLNKGREESKYLRNRGRPIAWRLGGEICQFSGLPDIITEGYVGVDN